MNVRWCAPSGGGCSGGRVSDVVSVATHDVHPGCAKLVAGLAQRACGAGVANLDLVTMRPAVPNLVPCRFGAAPVRGADMGFHQQGRSHWCGRGWDDASGAHLCDGELDVGNGFGERCVGGYQVLNGGILLNGCICQIVKRRSHLLCLVKFGSLICTKRCVAGSHAIDVTHFGNGGSSMCLPVGPSVVNRWAMFPLAPGQHHVAAH
jgi:hypothetical protein